MDGMLFRGNELQNGREWLLTSQTFVLMVLNTHTQPEPELVSQSAVRIYIISYNMPSQLGDWPSLLFPWVLLYISTPYSRLYPAIRLQLPPAASLHCSHPHFRSTSAILMMARRPDPPPLSPTHSSMRIISFSRCL
jgi:hypothetical protein